MRAKKRLLFLFLYFNVIVSCCTQQVEQNLEISYEECLEAVKEGYDKAKHAFGSSFEEGLVVEKKLNNIYD